MLSLFTPLVREAESYGSNISEVERMMKQINETILRNYVQAIQNFGPHPTGSEACNALANYIYNELKRMKLSVRYDNWSYKGRCGKNIEATLTGRSLPNRTVIVCAHYDSVLVSPGADDDGSGVSAVLAMARAMSEHTFNSTIKFVLFSGEEQGRLGSHEYVRKVHEKGENIAGVITLDGIGYAVSSEDGSRIKNLVSNESSWIYDISMKMNEIYGKYIGLEIIRLPNEPISDHQSFLDYGYDASYFLEYRIDPYYHTSEDKIEYMNMTYLKKVSRLAMATLAFMADSKQGVSNDDLKIKIKGSILSYPAQLTVGIENSKYEEDTANLTIKISMKNLFNGEYVKGPYNTTCNWTFSKEIRDYWEFRTISRSYGIQFFVLDVIIDGFNDDTGIHKEKKTYGVTFFTLILLIPSL
ncbi:MAG: Zn-dependent exopeptidase M28 [Thermoplasmata archaeon]|nr:Zn-dependent exopeptidase M28 [Thermoplasmata archaeon]